MCVTKDIVGKLNALCENDNIRKDIEHLIETRIECSPDTIDSEGIVVSDDGNGNCTLGALGLINGLLSSPIIAVFGDDGHLVKFESL